MVRQNGNDGRSSGLTSFSDRSQVMAAIARQAIGVPPRCIVIGAKGRCGQGAVDAQTQAGCAVTQWDKDETQQFDRASLYDHDLLVNCVLMTGPGLRLIGPENLTTPGMRISTISDVSCDPLSDWGLWTFRIPIVTDFRFRLPEWRLEWTGSVLW